MPRPGSAAALKATAKASGDAKLHTGAAYAKDATKSVTTFLAMLYVLLGFSVIVSLFGMVNTLVLSVFERTRELGMLRAIGMTRRQARRMIRHESVITALIGAALGLGLGVLLAALVDQRALEVRRRDVAARADAGGVHRRRDPRRHRRGDPARTTRLTAQRARRPPLRMIAVALLATLAIVLPAPAQPVGVTQVHLADHARVDPWTHSGPREVDVSACYPARRAVRTPARYVTPGSPTRSRPAYQVPAAPWHGRPDPRRAGRGGAAGRHPIVLVTPGVGHGAVLTDPGRRGSRRPRLRRARDRPSGRRARPSSLPVGGSARSTTASSPGCRM